MRKTARGFGIPGYEIRTGAKFLFLLIAVLWPSGAIGRESSLICIYDILTSAREMMMLCGERLDSASESAYDKLRTDLKKFINDNVKFDAHRIAPNYDESRRLHLREETKNGRCERQEYQLAKTLLRNLLHPESQLAIRKRLQTPADPAKGTCF